MLGLADDGIAGAHPSQLQEHCSFGLRTGYQKISREALLILSFVAVFSLIGNYEAVILGRAFPRENLAGCS